VLMTWRAISTRPYLKVVVEEPLGRGLHTSTIQLNLCRFCHCISVSNIASHKSVQVEPEIGRVEAPATRPPASPRHTPSAQARNTMNTNTRVNKKRGGVSLVATLEATRGVSLVAGT